MTEMSKVNFRGPHDLPEDLTVLKLQERERNAVYDPEERLHQKGSIHQQPI